MRNPLVMLSCMLLLGACGGGPDAEEAPAAKGSDLALPVTAPMGAREHLLGELEAHDQREKQRSRTIESLLPGRR